MHWDECEARSRQDPEQEREREREPASRRVAWAGCEREELETVWQAPNPEAANRPGQRRLLWACASNKCRCEQRAGEPERQQVALASQDERARAWPGRPEERRLDLAAEQRIGRRNGKWKRLDPADLCPRELNLNSAAGGAPKPT